MDPSDWYRRNYPHGPDHDERCLTVLCSIAAIYNLPIVDYEPRPMIPLLRSEWSEARYAEMAVTGEYPTVRRSDGGIRKWGAKGLSVILRTSLATFDFAELTRLDVAAHEHHCRVEVGGTVLLDDGDLEYMDNYETAQAASGMRLSITPRVPASENPHMFARHPGLLDLRDQIDQRLGIAKPTRTQTLLRNRRAA